MSTPQTAAGLDPSPRPIVVMFVWLLAGVAAISLSVALEHLFPFWSKRHFEVLLILLLGGVHLILGTIGGSISGALYGRKRVGVGAAMAILPLYICWGLGFLAWWVRGG